MQVSQQTVELKVQLDLTGETGLRVGEVSEEVGGGLKVSTVNRPRIILREPSDY